MDISATSKPVSNLARSLDSLDNGSAPLSHQPQLFEKEVSGEVSQNQTLPYGDGCQLINACCERAFFRLKGNEHEQVGQTSGHCNRIWS
jgi:hypothetical protein